MKKIVILHTYPNTTRHLSVLSECLDIYKGTEYDVLLVSHYPVPAEIYKKANYYLFDEDNSMLPAGAFLTQHFFDIGNHRAVLAYPGHALPITRSMRKSVAFVKALGYDFFWFSEADCLLSNTDLTKLDSLRSKMFEEDKSMVYFRPDSFRDGRYNSLVYETLIFGGRPVYFLAKAKLPTTLEEWVAADMDPMLEYSFYKKFSDDEKDFVIVNDHSSNYFTDSQINVFRYEQFACELLDNGTADTVTLFLHNVQYNKSNYRTLVKLNGQEVFNEFFCIGCWMHRGFDLNGDLLEVEVYENDLYSYTKTYTLTRDVQLRGTFRPLS